MSQRSFVSSGSQWENQYGYARAVLCSGHIFVSGTTSITPTGEVIGPNNAYLQARQIFQLIDQQLRRLGSSLSDVVRTRMYVTDIHAHADAVGRAHAEVFESIRPASTMIGVVALIQPELLVEIEVDAIPSTSQDLSPHQTEHSPN
ncbi:MAG: RidA family protein [Bacteroidetes bacterium]|nr:RidA family protein [Bacteroidota bacterium]